VTRLTLTLDGRAVRYEASDCIRIARGTLRSVADLDALEARYPAARRAGVRTHQARAHLDRPAKRKATKKPAKRPAKRKP